MSKIERNRGTGAGGHKTNKHGISFENNIYLKKWILDSGFELVPLKENNRSEIYQIFKGKELIGFYGRQGTIYNALMNCYPKVINKSYIKEVLSKKINPDSYILNIKKQELIIFEKKWQQTSGSVDEKLQTAPFKLEMFEKLLRNTNLKVKYQYILSSWFKSDQYRNIREYYEHNNQVGLWIEDQNLQKIDIIDFLV